LLNSFTEDVYISTVKEDAPVGAIVGKVHADDRDAGVNRKILYALLSVTSSANEEVNDQFGIDVSSGILSLLRPLDRELVSHYNLTLQVRSAKWEIT